MLKTRLALGLLLVSTATTASEFTYRGTLSDGAQPANGSYDLRLTLFDESGTSILVGPVMLYGVEVAQGRFAADLDLDLGLNPSRVPVMQIKTEVAGPGEHFVAVGALQRFDPGAAGAGTCWDTQGNSGTDPATDFLGTDDAAPLSFRVNNVLVGRIEATLGAPNVRFGSQFNSALNGVESSVVLGGSNLPNFGNMATGNGATILGGSGHVAEAGGTIVGGRNSHAGPGAFAVGSSICAGGDNSFAIGHRAKIRHKFVDGNVGLGSACSSVPHAPDAQGDNGTFVWADDSANDFTSSGDHQFLVRAGGGLMFNTSNLVTAADDVALKARADTADLDMDIRLITANGKSASMYLRDSDGGWRFSAPNLTGPDFMSFTNNARLTAGGTWTNASSRKLKRDFASVDSASVLGKVLSLPITTWQYKASDEGTHMGPIAEDFHAAFGLGGSDRSISTVDADGVALAAIQGLYQVMAAQRQQLHDDNAQLRAQNADLQQRVSAIESRRRERP